MPSKTTVRYHFPRSGGSKKKTDKASVGKNVENMDPRTRLVGVGNSAASVEDGLAIPQKVKQNHQVAQQLHS